MGTVVLKLGGSLITDKRRPFTLRRDTLERVSTAVAEAAQRHRVVLVHGGGSYGHYAVQRAGGLAQKLVTDVSYWMTVLNVEVVSALLRAGALAAGLPTWAVAHRSAGRLRLNSRIIEGLLELNVVPVTHGGLIATDEGTFEILSGDTLAAELAIELPASALIYLMDADGVYTDDPRLNPRAELIRVLRREDVDRVRGGSAGVDVTGGLALKLREAFRAAERGVRVALGGLESLRSMLEGVEGRYTTVVA